MLAKTTISLLNHAYEIGFPTTNQTFYLEITKLHNLYKYYNIDDRLILIIILF